MSLAWDGEQAEREAARTAAREKADLLAGAVGDPITIANEFAEVRLVRVETRNGARLLLESPKSGQWVSLDPLELESLTWQSRATFSALVGHPFGPLIADDPDAPDADGGHDGPDQAPQDEP